MRGTPVQEFTRAQKRMLDRFRIDAKSRFIEVPLLRGRAHALVAGEGPPVVLVNGIGTPAAMWAPLMRELEGFTLFGVDLPGFGLTDTVPHLTDDLRSNAVSFLEQVLDQLGLDRPVYVANSLGSLWVTWLSIDRPDRVAAMTHVGCPAVILDSSAPLPMRLLSVPLLGRLLTLLDPPSLKQVERLAAMVKEDLSDLPELRDLLLATEKLPAFEATFLPMIRTLLHLGGSRPKFAQTAEQLERVTQPVQLFWGKDDPFGPPEIGERAARILPKAEFHIVAGGHVPWIDEPQRISHLAAPFLRTHSSAAGS